MTELINSPLVDQVEMGHKWVDDEMIYRYVRVFGDDAQGYQASYETWFIPAGGSKIEFFEVLFDTTTYRTAAEALADAMPSAQKETAAWLATVEPVEQPKPTLNPAEYEITDGYVGSFGKTYKAATEATLTEAIAAAAKRNDKSTNEIVQMIVDGQPVEWCNSPNYYYDHSKGIIRRKRTTQPVALVKCDCGHSVPRSQVMSASLGTSCPDCYDRMSD